MRLGQGMPLSEASRIDTNDRKIYVDRTREQIKDAPEFGRDKHLGNADYDGEPRHVRGPVRWIFVEWIFVDQPSTPITPRRGGPGTAGAAPVRCHAAGCRW